jgi:hypothetical protein
MATGPLKKITAKLARDICSQFEMAAEAKALLDDQVTPHGLLDRLVEKDLFTDAIKLLSFGLPKREAVWWAAGCVRATLPADPPPAIVDALKAAETWVYKPTEENRWAAKEVGEKAGYDKPACWVALGAFWSSGSMVPAHLPQMLPGPAFTANAVSGAVMMSAALGDPNAAPGLYKLAIEDAVDIAGGGTGKRRAEGAAAPPAAKPASAPART